MRLYRSTCDPLIACPAQNNPQLCSWDTRDQSLETSGAMALFAVVVSSRQYYGVFLSVLEQFGDGEIFGPGASGVCIKLGKIANPCFVTFIARLLKFDFDQFYGILSYWLRQSKAEYDATDVSAHKFALVEQINTHGGMSELYLIKYQSLSLCTHRHSIGLVSSH